MSKNRRRHNVLDSYNDCLIRRLQVVQNTAARLVTGTWRRDHISPVLRQLHWLPVHQRIKFKLAVLVHKSLYGLPPKYLVEDSELVAAADRRQLRSSDVATFVVPRTNTRLGDRAFPVAGPRSWNSLPSNLRQSDLTVHRFRQALKTYLFVCPRLQHLVTCVLVCYTNALTYLLTYFYDSSTKCRRRQTLRQTYHCEYCSVLGGVVWLPVEAIDNSDRDNTCRGTPTPTSREDPART